MVSKSFTITFGDKAYNLDFLEFPKMMVAAVQEAIETLIFGKVFKGIFVENISETGISFNVVPKNSRDIFIDRLPEEDKENFFEKYYKEHFFMVSVPNVKNDFAILVALRREELSNKEKQEVVFDIFTDDLLVKVDKDINLEDVI